MMRIAHWVLGMGCASLVVTAGERQAHAYTETIRYTTTGTVDFQAPLGGGPFDQATAVAVASNGKIVEAGFVYDSSNKSHLLVGRLNTNGSVDTSFGFGGITSYQFDSSAQYEEAVSIALTPAGSSENAIAVLGNSIDDPDGSFTTFMVRFTGTGAVDSTFPVPSEPFSGASGAAGYSLKRRADGTYAVLANDADLGDGEPGFYVARLNSNGSRIGSVVEGDFAGTFSSGNGSVAYDLACDSNGRIAVVGETPPISSMMGKQVMGVARYTSAGALDTSFGTGGIKLINITVVGNQRATGVAYDSSNRMIVVGRPDNLSDFGSGANVLVARLADGVSDQVMFDALSGTSVVANFIPSWHVATTGVNFYIGGNAHVGSFEEFASVRVLGGTFAVDTAYSGGRALTGISGKNAVVQSIAVGTDGKPVVAGRACTGSPC